MFGASTITKVGIWGETHGRERGSKGRKKYKKLNR